jgi:site-specific recombinase XerD
MLKGGADIDNLRILMGHNSPEQTAVYAKVDREMIRSALMSNPLLKYFERGAFNEK